MGSICSIVNSFYPKMSWSDVLGAMEGTDRIRYGPLLALLDGECMMR